MVLPNFIIAGAQKSGTSSLFTILNQHPDIFLPDIKETHFFDNDEFYNKGLGWYEKTFFKGYNGEKAVGDNTPGYMFKPGVAERIARDLGTDIKLVFILRNPADRMFSFYEMQAKNQVIPNKQSFEQTLKDELKKKGNIEPANSMVLPSLYGKHIKDYAKFFPLKNMHFIIFETEFIQRRNKTIKDLLKFLNVKELELNTDIRSNPNRKPKSKLIWKTWNQPVLKKIGKTLIPNPITRRKLRHYVDKMNTKDVKKNASLTPDQKKALIQELFYDDIKELEKLTDKDLSVWHL